MFPPVVRADVVRRPPTNVFSVGDGHAHRAGGAGDDLGGRVDVVGVEVGHLRLGDLADLRPGDLGDLGLVRLAAALVNAGGLQDQLGRRRSLRDEVEGPVLIDADLDRYDVAALRLGGRVVGLAELHDVDAVLPERGTNGRRGGGRTGVDLQLDDRGEFLLGRHLWIPRSWRLG